MNWHKDIRPLIFLVFILSFASQSSPKKLPNGNNEAFFTYDLLHAVTNEWTRRAVSPILYRNSLIEASLGGNDEATVTKTQSELESAARIVGSKAQRAKEIEKSTKENHINKAIFLNKGIDVRTDHESINSNKWHTEHLDLKEPAAAVKYIKGYAASKTGNMIQRDRNIVIGSEINEDTAMITLDTIHVSHKWEQQFLVTNYSKDGHGLMLTNGCYLYGYLKDLKATALVLGLNGTDTRLLLLFADEKYELSPLEKRLKSVDVTKIPAKLKITPHLVQLPTTIVETVYSVRTEILSKLDIQKATSDQAELDNFFTKKIPVYIKNFFQFTAIHITQTEFSFSSMTSVQYQKITGNQASYSAEGNLLNITDPYIGKNPFYFYLLRGNHILGAGNSFIHKEKKKQ